ncbi:hypothetical protein PtB15_6B600 [Puccinia triticina]|nr:hypothetical protein PtB15_6B600 [Puccinia triticina]
MSYKPETQTYMITIPPELRKTGSGAKEEYMSPEYDLAVQITVRGGELVEIGQWILYSGELFSQVNGKNTVVVVHVANISPTPPPDFCHLATKGPVVDDVSLCTGLSNGTSPIGVWTVRNIHCVAKWEQLSFQRSMIQHTESF